MGHGVNVSINDETPFELTKIVIQEDYVHVWYVYK